MVTKFCIRENRIWQKYFNIFILGLLKPTSGSIEVDKKCKQNFKDWSKKIDMFHKNFTIDDTILANIAFGVDKEKIDKN